MKNFIVATFAERLNTTLERKNIKAVDLAEKLGVSESTISNYRRGFSAPKKNRLAKMADILDVSVSWLLGLNVPMEEPKEPAPTLDQQLEGIEFALLGEVKELTEEQKQDVLNFAKFIKEQNKNK